LDGPQPNLPSAGRRLAGMAMPAAPVRGLGRPAELSDAVLADLPGPAFGGPPGRSFGGPP